MDDRIVGTTLGGCGTFLWFMPFASVGEGMYQAGNNIGNFVEYLDPTLHLAAIFRALHGFVSDEGESRPAVPEILKEGYVVRALDGLMFYSVLLRLNLVSLRVRKVHGGDDLLVQNDLVIFDRIPELLPIGCLHA